MHRLIVLQTSTVKSIVTTSRTEILSSRGERKEPHGMRRQLLISALALGAAALLPTPARAAATEIEVWKSPTCGCCVDWIAHLEKNGFTVRTNDTGNAAARRRLGIDERYGSCHTAVADGYVIEGHVPAGDIRRLLRERPQALGLAVPGMPIGSPGMDGPAYKGRKDPYDVLLLDASGGSSVYQAYR